MPIKIYHPDHGIVLTNEKDVIDSLVAKGGKIIKKNKEILGEVVEDVVGKTVKSKDKAKDKDDDKPALHDEWAHKR
jgi:hypothetical protein